MSESEQSESVNEIAGALSKAQTAMEHAEKGRQNPHLRNRYSTLADVLDACRPALSANGIAIIQQPSLDGDVVTVRTKLVHSSGQWFGCTLSAPVGDAKGVTKSQAIGSVITYLRRYGLSALAVIASDDDDGEGARPQRQPDRRPEPAPPAEAAPPPTEWTDDERVAFVEALSKVVPLDVTEQHVADYCESVGGKPPERMTAEGRQKLLAALADPAKLAKLVAFAKERP